MKFEEFTNLHCAFENMEATGETPEVLDFNDELLDSYDRMFIKDDQLYYGYVTNYFGDTAVINLSTGDFGWWDYETNSLEKLGNTKITDYMKKLNNYLLDTYDYDDIIEHC